MIHVGMGPTHLVNFLGQCNIPPPSEPSIRKHAAKVGKAITDVALESCRAAQVEEKQTSDTLQASFDGGWQKRGTGWNYNSISVRGFIDTLQLCRRVISKEEVSNCYKQEHLVKMLTGQTYAAHNALADVKSLQKLIELRLFEHISNSDYYSIMYHACMASYVHLDGPKKICKSVSEKLSRSGVSLQHVKLAISRDLKAAKMMLQTHKISCKQAENVVKILLCEE